VGDVQLVLVEVQFADKRMPQVAPNERFRRARDGYSNSPGCRPRDARSWGL